MKICQISLSNYNIRQMPDYKALGKSVDAVLKKHFFGKRLAIRCISSNEHKGKTVNELIKIISKNGTDRYIQEVKYTNYKNVGNKRIDFFALDRTVTLKNKIMWQFFWSFYHFPKLQKLKPAKIDLVILYDRKQLKSVRYTEDGKKFKQDGFIFKNSLNKPKAVEGFVILKI